MKGFFISIEGADGSGKSVQAKLLLEYFLSQGINAIITREPGGTSISELIRTIIIDKNNNEMDNITEIFLFAAARSQIVNELIKPSLDKGITVICERYTDSSIAYQCFGRGLDFETISRINDYATGGLLPDVTFFLDLPPEISAARKAGLGNLDRLELEGLSFQKKVYYGYKEIAENNPRIVTIDASAEPQQVHGAILNQLKLIGRLLI